jgi:hypothetical protein
MIGVSEAYNGTACPSFSSHPSCQRQYELTPTVCNQSLPSAYGYCPPGPTGGAELYLDFVWNDVIPQVMNELELSIGEVSGAGFRYLLSYYIMSFIWLV